MIKPGQVRLVREISGGLVPEGDVWYKNGQDRDDVGQDTMRADRLSLSER